MLGKRHTRLLLPIDHQIIEAVGFTEAEYLEYLRLQEQLSRTRPTSGPVAVLSGFELILIGVAINAALTAAAYLLTPRLKKSPGAPGQLRQNDQQGLRLVDRTEFAPKAGISSSQDVVELGSTVPVVFANRETIDGVTYGGVRVNCPMLWSQMVSLGGSQMLRAVYLLGEAPISGIDPSQFAFGENLLSSYDLGAAGNDASARVTIYHRPGGGRIRSTDRIAGRLAANDPGNAEASGAADVFQVRGLNNAWVPATCYSYSPSSQTTFGLYAPIGNGLPYRVNPIMRSARLLSTVQAPTRSQQEDGYSLISCSPDHAALVQRQKNDSINQARGGLRALRRGGTTITAPDTADLSVTFNLVTNICDGEAHGLRANDGAIFFAPTGTLPTGLVERRVYYVISSGLTADTFAVAAAPGGAAIDLVGTDLSVVFDTITDTVNATSHGLNAGDEIKFKVATGIFPNPLQERTVYYVISAGLTNNTFAVATTPEGAAIDLTGYESPVTFDLTANTGNATAHGLAAGDKIELIATTGFLPTGLAERTAYYVRSTGLTADAFTIATTPGGAEIDLTGTATGTYKLSKAPVGTYTLRRVFKLIRLIKVLTGDEIDYFLDNETSAENTFVSRDYSELRGDIGTAIASRQRQWDDSIIVGETYRVGSALAVCKSRTPSGDVFRSDVESQPVGGGVAITATFAIVTEGFTDFPTSAPPGLSSNRSGTSRPHIMRSARATIAVPQPAQVIELGGKSTVGIKISGFCNLKDSPSYSQIDLNACDIFDGDLLAPNQTLQTTSFQSGTITQVETHYSFWRLRYRIAGSSASWSQFPQLMGVSGSTQQQQYWFNRLELPSRQRWEVDYLPVSGWEIRSGVATGDLVVIDARLSTLLTLTDGTAVVRVPGRFLSPEQSKFLMPCTTPSVGDVGIPYVDRSNIADDWGRLAEQFVYEEFSASTSAPEHEIVYVNVIDNAPSAPSYDNLALVAVNIRSGSEAATLGQLSAYVNQAVASHSFPDLLSAALTNERYGVGSILSPLQVDTASFIAATAWTRGRRYFWDGTLPKPVNIREWGNDTAALFLLDLVTRNGVSYLQPAVLFGEVEQITGIFNGGNIVEGSFKLTYFPQQDRQRIRVSVKWREERAAVGDGSNRGLFPVIREVTVREAGTSDTAPIETIDMSEFCTSERHAIDVAKLKCRLKRLSSHQVDLSTIPQQATLTPGRCFRLAMETVAYAKPRNGAILADGTIIASDTIANGAYSVLLWDGVGGIQETTITITGGKAVGQGQAVFTIAELAAKEQTYKVQSMGFNEQGNIDVVALHWPTDTSGYSLISAGWDVAGNWTIEGAIGSTDAPGTIVDSFTGVTIVGASSLTVGIASSYSAVVSGTGTGYSYSWSGGGLTFGSPTAAVTTITTTSAGTKTASCAVTRSGVTITGTQAIAALSAASATTLGTVTISGATTGTGVFSSSYSVAISGTATDLVYSWSAPIVPASRSVTFSATNAVAPTITFSGTGTYTLLCRVSSFAATDRSVDKPVSFNLTTDTCNATAHGLATNDEIGFAATTGTLPTGLAERTSYYVRTGGLTADAFTVATTPGGAAIDLSGTAIGTYRVNRLGKSDLHTVVVS